MNIVITGASSGMGNVIGEYLASKGHRVIGTSRYRDEAFGKMEMVKLDVTRDDSVENFLQAVLQRFQTVDVLINCAGFVLSGPVEDTSIEECKNKFETNYFGLVRVVTKFLPLFRAQQYGKIINISSLGGMIGMPFQAHYSASKFALEGFTEALKLELLPFDVQVCNVNPGDFNTSFTANRKVSAVVGDAYRQKFEEILAVYEKDEKNGSDPILIAKLIDSLIQKKKLKIRYLVGKRSQTVFPKPEAFVW